MMSILRGDFRRDLTVLLVVTVLLGSLLSGGLAYATNGYFGQAITGLLGDYGEYDFIVSVRQELGAPAGDVVRELVRRRYTGGRVKQGVTVAGKVNFLVSIPRQMRRRDVLEGLQGVLAGVPGYSGYTIIMEPRVTVRGMQPGTVGYLMAEFMKLRGVVFAFRNETGCDVIVLSEDDLRRVENEISRILSAYKVVEGRFPMGVKVDNVSAVGADVAARIKADMGARTAIDISLGDVNKDMQHFVRTLSEMRRFLLGYATEVKVRGTGGAGLLPGDLVLLAPEGPRIEQGRKVSEDSTIARIMGLSDSTASAVIVQGDSAGLVGTSSEGFRSTVNVYRVMTPASSQPDEGSVPSGGVAGPHVGSAKVWAQRRELVATIAQSIELLGQLGRASVEADKTLSDLGGVLSNYEQVLARVSAVKGALEASKSAIGGSVTKLEGLRTGDFRRTINQSAQLVDLLLEGLARTKANQASLVAAYQGTQKARTQVDREMAAVKATQPQTYARLVGVRQGLVALEAGAAGRLSEAKRLEASSVVMAADLAAWRKTVPALLLDFARLDTVLAQRVGVQRSIEQLLDSVSQAVTSLQNVDINSIRGDVGVAAQRLQALKGIDVAQIVKQLEYVQASLPSLRDDDIGRSVGLIDRYLEGQVIPGERVMVFSDKSVPDSFVAQAIRERTAVERISLISTSVGVVQPDIRGEVSRLLKEVRSTIAALVALVFTLVVLATDHATLMSAARGVSMYRASAREGGHLTRVLLSPGIYGLLVGGGVASSVALVCGARLPYVGAWPIGAIGALAGLLVSRVSERVSPVNASEIIGAESLGMPMSAVLRQVVIPGGRPGLMGVLNRGRVVLR